MSFDLPAVSFMIGVINRDDFDNAPQLHSAHLEVQQLLLSTSSYLRLKIDSITAFTILFEAESDASQSCVIIASVTSGPRCASRTSMI
jgi:hypothetical protein